MSELEIYINGVQFAEVPFPEYVILGDKDKVPFLNSGTYGGVDPHAPTSTVYNPIYRVYKSIQINGKFYAPIIQGGNNEGNI